MPKYLFTGSYTAEGARGVLKEGGSGRRDATEKLVASLGGTIEAYYFAENMRVRAFLKKLRFADEGTFIRKARSMPCGENRLFHAVW